MTVRHQHFFLIQVPPIGISKGGENSASKYLAPDESRVQEVNGDPSIVDPECQVLDLGAGDALDVGQLLQVEGWILGAVLVDVEQDGGRRRLEQSRIFLFAKSNGCSLVWIFIASN